MQLDLSQDYLTWDNTEPVTYISQRNTGPMLDTPLTAKRRAFREVEGAPSGGAYVKRTLPWLVPAVLLASGFVPKDGDVLTDAQQNQWTVLRVEGRRRDQTGPQTWWLETINPVISFDLEDLIDIEQATISYDAAGVKTKTFPADGGGKALYKALPCRVQLVSEEIVDERLVRGFKGTHAVYVSKQLAITQDFNELRVKLPDGSYGDIVDYKNPQRIDELPILGVEKRP